MKGPTSIVFCCSRSQVFRALFYLGVGLYALFASVFSGAPVWERLFIGALALLFLGNGLANHLLPAVAKVGPDGIRPGSPWLESDRAAARLQLVLQNVDR